MSTKRKIAFEAVAVTALALALVTAVGLGWLRGQHRELVDEVWTNRKAIVEVDDKVMEVSHAE